jgi:hypothetical protein
MLELLAGHKETELLAGHKEAELPSGVSTCPWRRCLEGLQDNLGFQNINAQLFNLRLTKQEMHHILKSILIET